MRYDRTGITYAQTRRPDPRIAAMINQAIGDEGLVANIGAGTGSYEPAQTVVAVEPSRVMIEQRPPGSAPAVRAIAEALPLRTGAVDSALAVFTVHHWSDLAAGIAEVVRVARRRVVILTWDPDVIRDFWLLSEYFPAAAETDARLAVSINALIDLLGHERVSTLSVPVPHDCMDGFGGAYWRRPEAYLDNTIRQGMSLFAMTPNHEVHKGLSRLRADLTSGAWGERHPDLLAMTDLDVGYRLLIADLT